MKVIPSFKPTVSYKQLNTVLLKILFSNISDHQINIFENKFAQYLGIKHAICVSSGRWGLYYILESLNLKEGDEIILPAFTYFAVPAVIVKLGLKPVFVDINPDNLNIDTQKIKENITNRTRVIIPTHLCGFVCELDEILDIAHRYNITIIEDCAQTLGAEYKNKKVGSFGSAAYFTFGVTKNFTTLGNGMVVTDDKELADNIRYVIGKMHPISREALFFKFLSGYIMKFMTSSALFPYVYYIMRIFSFLGIDIIDYIFREKESLLGNLPNKNQLNNIQAELGVMQLGDLDRKNDIRRKKGLELYSRLKGVDNIRTPLLNHNGKNIFSTCPILVKNKKDTKKILLKKGIDVSAGYMQDCSRLDIFKKFKRACPNSSGAEDEILYLPAYAELAHSELIYVADTIKQIAVRF